MQRVLGGIALSILLAACGSTKTKRVDIADDDEIMGTGVESADVEGIARLAESMLETPYLTGPNVEGVPTVALHPIENNTRFDFDAENLVRRIQMELVNKARGKVQFVTRKTKQEALIERERQRKREGEYTSSKQETKTGADYYLTGSAHAVSKAGKGLESDAIWIDFELIDAENGNIIWGETYKTKKVGKAGVVYR